MATVLNVSNIDGVPFSAKIIPASNSNRPQISMNPTWLTIHETDNTSAGADAQAHSNFITNGGGSAGVSWHFTVDDKQIIQHLPLNEVGWHAGSTSGNYNSIGTEICVNSDGNYAKAKANAAKLTKYLMGLLGISLSRVVPHQHWSGKNCPRNLLASGFQGFKDLVSGSAGSGSGGGETTPPTGGGGNEGIGVVYITGTGVNVRTGPGTNYSVRKQVNSTDAVNSFIVWEVRDGWLNVGGDQWIKNDSSFAVYKPYSGGSTGGGSYVGKRVVSKVDGLNFYDRPTWDKAYVVGTVDTGYGFEIVDRIDVDGSPQYKVKNSKGAIFYITASPTYVDVK
ncbi:endolysin [Bacillus phage Nachito]|nr:endolysin [Bacillus phage Nachito]